MNMKNIFEDATWEGFDESPRRQMMVVIRSIMVIVLQLIAMKELIGALKSNGVREMPCTKQRLSVGTLL